MPTKQKKIKKANPECIRVCVRIRPLGHGETTAALQVGPDDRTVEGMAFDAVFPPDASQKAVFETVLPVIDSWIEGFNACVFAYGQTGSGKTHTMLGADGGKKNLDGIIPQAVSYALNRVQQERAICATISEHASDFCIFASYMELYNDELRDLLTTHPSDGRICVRETPDGVVFVDGAASIPVSSPAEVIQLVNQGSRQRATHGHNMNEFSSRSHAVFTLSLEHRWKDASCAHNPRAYKSKSSLLNLVDLAGSEYAKKTGNTGDRLQESIAINTGLFTLGQVIAALVERKARSHIPYRDHILTRVLQSSLGGNSKTVMVACCSPDVSNLAESTSTLKWAFSARDVCNEAAIVVNDGVEEAQPLDNDILDPEPYMNRRTIWLRVPSWGDVFCRCIGEEANPLILFVHGSGPLNSSTYFSGIAYNVVVQSPTPYFCVAIDCPGYGRSHGDRQTIRSSPGAFLFAIIHALGYDSAYCMVGSSQGACAVFNAALECPQITQHLAVMDPVGHDVFRYKAIKQPTLLAFDIEDEGHPVKVGRWMRDNLQNNTYFEYASSRSPYWVCDHFAFEICRMLERTRHHQEESMGGMMRGLSMVAESMGQLAGGLFSWVEHNLFGAPAKDLELLLPPSTLPREVLLLPDAAASAGPPGVRRISPPSSGAQQNAWTAIQDKASGRVLFQCIETQEIVCKLPKGVRLVGGRSPPAASSSQSATETNLFVAPKNPQEKRESQGEAEEREHAERAQVTCDRCKNPLWLPRRLRKCRHVLCGICFRTTSKYSGKCSVCQTPSKVESFDECHQQALGEVEASVNRAQEHEQFERVLNESIRVIIEYGNGASSGTDDGPCTYDSFCRVAHVELGAECKLHEKPSSKSMLARVAFDINPDYPKAAIKVTAPPFVLQRTMVREYPCFMTLHFTETDQAIKIPDIWIPYYVSRKPRTCRFLIVQISNSGLGCPAPKKMATIQLSEEQAASGVVILHL